MNINLNLGEWNTVFPVPAAVVDKHLKAVSGSYIKVLLMVLRHAGSNLSDEEIAQQLFIPQDEVMEAVRYWNSVGIFSLGGDTGVKINNITKLSTQPSYLSSEEISQLLLANPEVKFMFDKLELLYGRPISSTEQKNYVYLYESAGLPADVIIMIAEYCISIDHASILYIKKVALNWAEDGITTHEKAAERILSLSKRHQMEYKVKKHFGIDNRSLSAKEKEYIKTWTDIYHYDIDMIQLAYDRTVNQTGRISWKYLDTILKSWNDNQIRTAEDVEKKDTIAVPKKSGEKSGKKASYDIEKFNELGYDIPEIELE